MILWFPFEVKFQMNKIERVKRELIAQGCRITYDRGNSFRVSCPERNRRKR